MVTAKCCGCGNWYTDPKSITVRKTDVFSSGFIVEYDIHISKCPGCETETQTEIRLTNAFVTTK